MGSWFYKNGNFVSFLVLMLLVAFSTAFLFPNIKTNIYGEQDYRKDLEMKISSFLTNFNDSLQDLLQGQSYDSITRGLAEAVLEMPDVPSCSEVLANVSVEDNINRITEFLHVYKNFAEGVSGEYSISLPYLDDTEIRKFTSSLHADDLIFACSIIDDYKELRKDAGQVLLGDDAAVSRFYERLFTISLKIIFMQESIAYKVSYKLVGATFIESGLYKTILTYGGKQP